MHRDGDRAYTLMDSAAGSGKVEVAQWLRDAHGVPFSDVTAEQAAGFDHMHMLKWLLEAGAPCDMARKDAKAISWNPGCPKTLEWLCAHGGGHWTAQQLQDAMREALQRGRRSLALWLRSRNVPWPTNLAAICQDYFLTDRHVVPWAVRQGCPWGEGWTSAACVAVSGGRRSVLRQLHELGAPCTCQGR
jgi:hypothetical protein